MPLLVVSDALRLAMRRGRLAVGGSGTAMLTFPEHERVLRLLQAFRLPAEAAAASRAAGLHPDDGDALVRMLMEIGALVADEPGRPRGPTLELLRDVRAMLGDPPPDVGVGDPLNRSQGAALDLVATLIGAMPVAAPVAAERVNVGCGRRPLAGWLNLDRTPPADLLCDVRGGLPVRAGKTSRVYMAHVLEHFGAEEAAEVLADVRRVLRPGGVLRLVVPDARLWLEAYCSAGDDFWADAGAQLGATWARPGDRLPQLLGYLGADPSGRGGGHRQGYDFECLSRQLDDAGFESVRRCAYQDSPHAELRVDDHSRAASCTVLGRRMSLFVEAAAPQPAS